MISPVRAYRKLRYALSLRAYGMHPSDETRNALTDNGGRLGYTWGKVRDDAQLAEIRYR